MRRGHCRSAGSSAAQSGAGQACAAPAHRLKAGAPVVYSPSMTRKDLIRTAPDKCFILSIRLSGNRYQATSGAFEIHGSVIRW